MITKPFTKSIVMAAAAAVLLTGCGPRPADLRLVDRSQVIQIDPYEAPFDPALGVIRLALANVTCAAAAGGRRAEMAESGRAHLTEVLVACPNIALANRAVSEELAAEWALVAGGAASPETTPRSAGVDVPRYLLKPTIVQVEHDLEAREAEGRWNLGVALDFADGERFGVVEIVFELIDVTNAVTCGSFRTAGLVRDAHQRRGINFGPAGGGFETTQRVPESQAIRSACEAASHKVLASLCAVRTGGAS